MDKLGAIGSMGGFAPGVRPGDIGPNGQHGPQKPGDPDPIGHPNGPGGVGPNGQHGPQKPGDPDPIGHPNGPDSVSLSSEATSGQQGPQKPGDPDPNGHPNGPDSANGNDSTNVLEMIQRLLESLTAGSSR